MFKFARRLLAFFVLSVVGVAPTLATGITVQPPPSIESSLLTGDVRLACEALLCLSGSQRPAECGPALSHFFGIKKRKLSDTLDARLDFLNLCPVASASSEMSSLVRAMARGAGRCDAKTLNQTLRRMIGPGGDAGYDGVVILDEMPTYCAAYILHSYTDLKDELPQYVGTPKEDGFWVEAKDYPSAVARYEREQAAKKARRENYGSGGN
ncbi:TrbM/KikA/MpfK family conjugal transfer protein [Bordetella petrii]|uniref:TrbM/KikA/MpfK family conjugal transfer protein n=1 Tax=Bordetella petrii TaxID=94624 RepID=UPI0006888BB8|nr:TrbM/KikA/MpfK family conjugal transfer protein [Bordetella petrii]